MAYAARDLSILWYGSPRRPRHVNAILYFVACVARLYCGSTRLTLGARSSKWWVTWLLSTMEGLPCRALGDNKRSSHKMSAFGASARLWRYGLKIACTALSRELKRGSTRIRSMHQTLCQDLWRCSGLICIKAMVNPVATEIALLDDTLTLCHVSSEFH